MKVCFPHGGRWLMLLWYEHDEGQQLVLSKRHSSVLATVRTLMDRDIYPEIRGYWEVDMWAPSPEMVELHTQFRELDLRKHFWEYIIWTASELRRKGQKLPEKLKVCTNYQPEDPRDAKNSSYKELHSECANCDHRIIVDVPDREAFFLARRAMFEATDKGKMALRDNWDDKGYVSRATPAKNGQKLLSATPNFGHHSEGVHLGEFILPEPNDTYRPSEFSQVLFFYTIANTLSMKEPQQLVKKQQAKNLADENKRMKASKLRQKKDLEETRAELEAFMRGPV